MERQAITMTSQKLSSRSYNFLVVYAVFLLVLVNDLLDMLTVPPFLGDPANSVVKIDLEILASPWSDIGLEDEGDLLEGLALGLWVHEKDVESHDEAEDTKDDICLPHDIGESWSDEKSEGEVKDPL